MRPSVRVTLRHQMRPHTHTHTHTHTHKQSSVPLATLPLPLSLLLTSDGSILDWPLMERNSIELNYTGLNFTGPKRVGHLVIMCPANMGIELQGSEVTALDTPLTWLQERRGMRRDCAVSLCLNHGEPHALPSSLPLHAMQRADCSNHAAK